jgi:hypothetical protein
MAVTEKVLLDIGVPPSEGHRLRGAVRDNILAAVRTALGDSPQADALRKAVAAVRDFGSQRERAEHSQRLARERGDRAALAGDVDAVVRSRTDETRDSQTLAAVGEVIAKLESQVPRLKADVGQLIERAVADAFRRLEQEAQAAAQIARARLFSECETELLAAAEAASKARMYSVLRDEGLTQGMDAFAALRGEAMAELTAAPPADERAKGPRPPAAASAGR